MLKNRGQWVIGALAVFQILTNTLIVQAEDNCTDFQHAKGPIIIPCQNEIVLTKGQNYTFICKGKTIVEFKQQDTPLEVNRTDIKEQRITNDSDIDYPFTTILDLYNVDEYSIGYYACFDSNVSEFDVLKDLTWEPDNTEHVSYIYIYVNDVKPPPTPRVTDRPKYFLSGERFILNCTVKYYNLIYLEWNYTQNVPSESITQDTNKYTATYMTSNTLYSALIINNATKEHAGSYMCISKNNCGSQSVTVEKQYLAKPFINLTRQNIGTSKFIEGTQKTTQFLVEVNAYPAVEVYVIRDNKNLTTDNSKKYAIKQFNPSSDVAFTIYDTSVTDTSNYTIVAYNRYMSANVTYDFRKIAPPHIEFGPDKKCEENTIVTFECTVTGYPLPTVSWSFNNETNLAGKVKSTVSLYGVTSILDLPVRTEGNVTCEATNDVGEPQSVSRSLFVYEVPDGFGLKNGSDLWYCQNENLAEKCYASIYDYDSVTWLGKDGENLGSMVEYSESSYSYIAELKINQISLEHSGYYTCVAESKSGIQRRQDVNITVAVLRSPVIKELKARRKEEHYPSITILLHCQADGVPPPKITWEKDGVILTNSSELKIWTQKVGRTTVNSTIIIPKAKEENEGKYECVAFSNTERRMSYKLLLKDQRAYLHYMIPIIVVILFLIVLVVYLTWKIKKMKQFKEQLAAAGLLYFKEGVTKSINPELGIDEQAELLPYDEKFEFPPEKLILGKQLGAGAFGVVYKAEARGIINAEETTPVAVKMVKKNAETMYIKALASELKIMVHLGKHVNIVNLLGACTKNVGKRELIVIVEYCKFGNIHNYMQRHREVFIDQLTDNKDKNLGKVNRAFSCSSGGSTDHSDYFGSTNTQDTDHTFLNTGNTSRSVRKENANHPIVEPTKVSEGYIQPEWRSNYESDYSFDGRNPRPLTSRDLLAWAFQIARGMEYLASRKILHGDLAARNVLLTEDNIVKICDFGLAKSIYKNDEYLKKENSPLPIKWLAIECMTDRIFSTQSDIWSFGIVLWELFTLAKTPYPNISPASLLTWLTEGNRLDKPRYADDRLYGVMKRCWEEKPTARPSFSELQEILGTFLEDNVRNHYVDLNSVYMQSNVKSDGQQDYLEMVSAPDYNILVTPSPHHYVNTRSFFPTTPTQLDEEGYLQMNRTPQGLFSPRPQGPTFDFEPRKYGARASEASSGSELTPMLALSRLPARSGSESDQEGPDGHEGLSGPHGPQGPHGPHGPHGLNSLHSLNGPFTTAPFPNGCPRIEEEADDVFEKINNVKNTTRAAVTNPTYITFDLDLEKKPKDIINNYVNFKVPVPNGIVE